MRPFRLLACLMALSLFAVPFVTAQTPTHAVFVPLVIVGDPPPPPIPQPTGECAQNAPEPEEGAQAWVTNGYPHQLEDITLCVRLIVQGRIVFDAPASAVVHYKTTDRELGPAYTNAEGVAALPFNIGGASRGYTVWIDALVSNQGRDYTAQTAFTPE
jgi:hypothetical protein